MIPPYHNHMTRSLSHWRDSNIQPRIDHTELQQRASDTCTDQTQGHKRQKLKDRYHYYCIHNLGAEKQGILHHGKNSITAQKYERFSQIIKWPKPTTQLGIVRMLEYRILFWTTFEGKVDLYGKIQSCFKFVWIQNHSNRFPEFLLTKSAEKLWIQYASYLIECSIH